MAFLLKTQMIWPTPNFVNQNLQGWDLRNWIFEQVCKLWYYFSSFRGNREPLKSGRCELKGMLEELEERRTWRQKESLGKWPNPEFLILTGRVVIIITSPPNKNQYFLFPQKALIQNLIRNSSVSIFQYVLRLILKFNWFL